MEEEVRQEVDWYLEFLKRVDEWDKSRDQIYDDKREAAFKFAVEILDADPDIAKKFIYRAGIKWDIIKNYAHSGKTVKCKVCGSQDWGGYWCSPCIHREWDCECCILLGNPFYSAGIYIWGQYKCQRCGYEFRAFKNLGSEVNLGVGVRMVKQKPLTCPKCGFGG